MFKNHCFNDLITEFNNNKNSHSYIFYTNDFFACKEDINKLVLNVFDTNNINNIVSDYLVVEKSEKKNILKDEISYIIEKFKNKTYINKKRIYLIEEVHKLNSSAANIILKFLEEPMEGIIAFFITDNLDAVLPTIKSRCQIINVFYENINFNDSKVDLLLDEFFLRNKFINLCTSKLYFKKVDRDKLIEIFKNYLIRCYNSFVDEDNLKKIKHLNKAINMLTNNVNIDYVFDYLILEGSNK